MRLVAVQAVADQCPGTRDPAVINDGHASWVPAHGGDDQAGRQTRIPEQPGISNTSSPVDQTQSKDSCL
jgi:hypothetical protein